MFCRRLGGGFPSIGAVVFRGPRRHEDYQDLGHIKGTGQFGNKVSFACTQGVVVASLSAALCSLGPHAWQSWPWHH